MKLLSLSFLLQILLQILPFYNCHLVLNDAAVWGIEDAVSLEYPLDANTENPVCSGRLPGSTDRIINFVAGQEYNFQVICGELDLNAVGCFSEDWHAGGNNDDYSGCGLSVVYDNDYTVMQSHKYISYSADCAKRGQDTTFKIAENIENCERCVCTWAWAPSRMYSSPGQFYSNCFYCSITGGLGDKNTMRTFDFINIRGTQNRDITYNDLNPIEIYETPTPVSTPVPTYITCSLKT